MVGRPLCFVDEGLQLKRAKFPSASAAYPDKTWNGSQTTETFSSFWCRSAGRGWTAVARARRGRAAEESWVLVDAYKQLQAK